MKVTLLFMLLNLYLTAVAQNPTARFKVFIRDTSSDAIFNEYPDLSYFKVSYSRGKANTIQAIYKAENEGSANEIYKLSFEGDRYALFKKYRSFQIPEPPKLVVEALQHNKNLGDSTFHIEVESSLRRDTICHDFSYHLLQKGTYWYTREDKYIPPKLREDPSLFEKKLTQAYRQWKPLILKDSALLITALVEPDGSMHSVKLALGDKSAFAEQVLKFIARNARPWIPMKVLRTKAIKGEAKMFVRLNRDDTVSFSTL